MYNAKDLSLSRAKQGLQALGWPGNLAALHKADIYIKRLVREIGSSHSVVTYPPVDALHRMPQEVIPLLQYGQSANLYIHIPFCEGLCTFCHYDKGLFRGASNPHTRPDEQEEVERYLEALKQEVRWWGERLCQTETTINSIYIGGGTPLILETSQLADLIGRIHREFAVQKDAEFCVEGSPLTIAAADGPDKLYALQQLGVTRLSLGIQSFDDEVLRLGGRGHTRDLAIQACSIIGEIFSNWNMDLIQSLCKGSLEEVHGNLQTLRDIRPPHLTYYHGRYKGTLPQGRRLMRRLEDFENEEETLVGRMMIWQEMAGLGYLQTDGNRFVRNERFTDPFKNSRTSVTNDLLGLGSSSYSHVGSDPEGWFFRNIVGGDLYVEMVNSGRWPIATGLEITKEEQLAASYVIGLRTVRWNDPNEQEGNHYQQLEQRLRSLGLTKECTAESKTGVRLTRLGQLFEDEVLSLFYSPAVRAALKTAG